MEAVQRRISLAPFAFPCFVPGLIGVATYDDLADRTLLGMNGSSFLTFQLHFLYRLEGEMLPVFFLRSFFR